LDVFWLETLVFLFATGCGAMMPNMCTCRLALLFSLFFCYCGLSAQTDETIFREFQFDFATPGARANAMGRAFVGLADEGTIAYNNPAGLALLSRPEVSLEWRSSKTQFDVLENNGSFTRLSGTNIPFVLDNEKLGFASGSLPFKGFNLSAFFINHLDYRRQPMPEQSRWLNLSREYEFSYFSDHDVQISYDTTGLSLARNWGRWNFGLVLGISRLRLDYTYKTILFSDYFELFEPVESEAHANLQRFSWVLGSLVEITPVLRWGWVYKGQPSFSYEEKVLNPQFPGPEKQTFAITFRVPDSLNTGLSWQMGDLWTAVLDLDYIRYSQLAGNNLTLISGNRFSAEDYEIPDALETHLGIEHLHPFGRHILAIRAGWFLDPNHKTRFVGSLADEYAEIQDFIFNTGTFGDNTGWTAGLGYVFNNALQWDVAWVRSDRYDTFVSSLLYRF
jgi:hypothetical protein